MNTWNDGVVESWSVGKMRLRALLQYSDIPIPRRQSTMRKKILVSLMATYFLATVSFADASSNLGYIAGRQRVGVLPRQRSEVASHSRRGTSHNSSVEAGRVRIERRPGLDAGRQAPDLCE